MSDRRPELVRRPGLGLVALLVILMLGAGVALMIYAVRSSGGWILRPAPAETTPAPALNFTPAQPQPAAPPLPQAPADPALLATRETALAGQLAALEARTAAVSLDADSAAGQAARAEAALVAFAARRAVDRGIGLGYLEPQLRERFGAARPRAVSVLIAAARTPVTLESLRQSFDASAGDLTSGGNRDTLASLWRELSTLVVIHDAGRPSPLPADRITRARRLLDDGRVEAAMTEVRRLPGATHAAGWLIAAQRWVDAHRALDVIEAAAILGQASPPPAPPVTTPPAPMVPPVAEGATPQP